MLYSIDKIEDNIVLLENIDNKEKKKVNKTLLPNEIKEGSILKYENDSYILDEETENKRRKELEDKLSRLKE